MFVSAIQFTYSQVFLDKLTDGLFNPPASALIGDLDVRLYTAVANPISPASVLGDFTEADFFGYEAQTPEIPPPGPINYPSNLGRGFSIDSTFIAGAEIEPPGQTILGYYLVKTNTSEEYIGGEEFAEPVPIVNPGDFLHLAAVLGNVFAQQVQEAA